MKILIVEDDPFKMKQLRKEVESFGVAERVDAAGSLQEATDLLSAASYGAVLLDMAIPSHAGTG